jgi:hypothetical protein
MPAAAQRHPEPEENPSPTPVAPADWEHYSSYIPRFSGHRDEDERDKRRRRLRRHSRFHLSALFCAGTLLTLELVALVWLYALDLKTIRQSNALDRDIKETSLQIALTQDRLAAQNASPRLSQWAQELGFVKAAPHDMDDVTKDTPMPVATVKAEKNR